MQIDKRERGFSFNQDGPLDMRMDLSEPLKAEDIVNEWPEKELGRCIKEYGEEPLWKKVTKAIVEARKRGKITSTKQLADIILKTVPSRGKKRIHPATLVFQALRICVNRELESLEEALKQAMQSMSQGSRIGAISFHSLEDRIVKQIFKSAAEPMKDLRGKKVQEPLMKIKTKKPIVPSLKEMRMNRRARSAKMRFAEKT